MANVAPSKAIVDLDAYAHNLRVTREMLPPRCRMAPVVKADAYGHGLLPIARRAEHEGADMLGVATVEEGLELREAGVTAPVLVLVQPLTGAIEPAVAQDLRLTISDIAVAEKIGRHARCTHKVVPLHCKIDTGMGRQGISPDGAIAVLRELAQIENIRIEGIATHFPVADAADDPFTPNQIRVFAQLLQEIKRERIPCELAHAANSATLINFPDGCFDLVRPGLMTYGVWPTNSPPEESPLRAVLRWETRIIMVKEFDAGAGIGYGRTHITSAPTRMAVLPVGYADGYRHSLGNKAHVLIRGKHCPVIGAVSMDQIVVDVTAIPSVAVGDVATLIGTDGDAVITAADLAELAGTIAYDILTGIGNRVERVYLD